MKYQMRRTVALICATYVVIFASAHADAQEFILDISMKAGAAGAEKTQDKQYTAMMGKETTISGAALYRVTVTPRSLSSDSVVLEFNVFDAGSSFVNTRATTIARLDRKAPMLHIGAPGSPKRLLIEATPRLK